MPTLTDYVQTLFTLFDRFMQAQTPNRKRGGPFIYANKTLIVFFILMQFRSIFAFKAQHRWLETHPELRLLLELEAVPHRTTLSRRYKKLYETIQDFVAFLADYACDLDTRFSSRNLVEDKSLVRASGPVWHQKDREAGHIPAKLRHLDTEATWSKSAYQGWVYGYGVHLTCNEAAFPQLVQVETASVSEGGVLDEKAAYILDVIRPETLSGDNGYAKVTRIRSWARRGVAFITPAVKWVKGRYAEAYHRFIKEPAQREHLKKRRTSVEPLFDLVGRVMGPSGKQARVPVQHLANVRTCLSLGVLTVQLAMIINSVWGLPLRNISVMAAVFS